MTIPAGTSKHRMDKYPINEDVRCPFYLLFILEHSSRRGNIAVAFTYNTVYLYCRLDAQNHRVLYTECQSFFSVPRIGSHPPPHQQGSVAPLPTLDPRKETHSLEGKGVRGDPIPTKGQTLWYSMYVYYNPSTLKTTGRQLPPLSSVLYGIISGRRSVLAAQLLLREKSVC